VPTDAEKLNRMLNELGLALCRQSIRREEQETANIKETARLLTKISTLLGETTGIKVKDLGAAFTLGIGTHSPFMPSKGAKKLK
jgi:hypothetical protein